MIKYKITKGFQASPIERVEVLRETESCVFFACKIGKHNPKGERKESKRTTYDNYFDTWEEAHAAYMQYAEGKLVSARRVLEHAQGYFGNVKGMKNREAA